MNARKRLSLETVTQLRGQIGDRLSHLPRNQIFRKSDVLKIAREYGAPGLTPDKLDYLVQIELVRPVREPYDSRTLYAYDRDDIRDVILVQVLREKFEASNGKRPTLARIASLLHDSAMSRGDGVPHKAARPDIGVPTQIERGCVYFRSRMLGVCLNWLFRGRLPLGGVVVLRRKVFESQPGNPHFPSVDYTACDQLEIDKCIGDLQPDDLFGGISEEGEVLLGVPRPNNLLDYRRWQWHYLEITHGTPRCLLKFVIGVPPFSAVGEKISQPLDSTDDQLLALTLESCFLKPESNSLAREGLAPKDSEEYSTPLTVITEILSDLSQAWQYCAVLTPDPHHNGHLRFAAMSSHFPAELRRGVSIEPGRLLSGWTYKHGCVAVVQDSSGRFDPRLAHQDEERATAAIAVPTGAQGHTNGVLYIGTRSPHRNHEMVFTPASTRLLRIVANIIGEIIERNHVRTDAERLSFHIVCEPLCVQRSWTELKTELKAELEAALRQDARLNPLDNLHLVSVSVHKYHELFERSPKVAQWLNRHIRLVTHRFYLESGLEAPKLFNRGDDRPAQFVCLLPCVNRTDEQDREWRSQLRRLLNSITIPFETQPHVEVRCFVWSMPFRLAGLLTEVNEEGVEATVARLVREAEEALVVLPFIEQGHKHEAQNAYPLALEKYLEAHTLLPENVYIMRHVAKTYAAVGNYQMAVEWWERVVSRTVHPSHLRRLAQVQACLGEFEAAAKAFKEAVRLAPADAVCYLEWGDVLLAHHHVEQAVEKYEQGKLHDEENAIVYLLRIAEAYAQLGDLQQAQSYARMALAREPDRWGCLRVLLQTVSLVGDGALGEGG